MNWRLKEAFGKVAFWIGGVIVVAVMIGAYEYEFIPNWIGWLLVIAFFIVLGITLYIEMKTNPDKYKDTLG